MSFAKGLSPGRESEERHLTCQPVTVPLAPPSILNPLFPLTPDL